MLKLRNFDRDLYDLALYERSDDLNHVLCLFYDHPFVQLLFQYLIIAIYYRLICRISVFVTFGLESVLIDSKINSAHL